MVSSRSPGVNVSPANSVATSRVVVSDSDVARDGDAILPSTRQSYRVEDEGGHVNGVPGAVEWSQSGPPSLSMSVDLHNLINPNLQDSGHYSASLEHADASASSCNVKSAKNHEEEESYEAFGAVEGDADDGVESPGGSSSAPSPTGNNTVKNPRSPNSTIGRHSWLRTSLRRTPPCSGRKRLSSNALASQLYRSGSFNSSGRGSNCDPADDMYSDVSLEDDVIDLNHRTADRKRDAKQNYPAEFVLYSDVTDPLDRDYNIICDGCEDRQRGNQSDCIWDRSRNESIIEYSSENKVNVATDISGTSMKEVSDRLLLRTMKVE